MHTYTSPNVAENTSINPTRFILKLITQAFTAGVKACICKQSHSVYLQHVGFFFSTLTHSANNLIILVPTVQYNNSSKKH